MGLLLARRSSNACSCACSHSRSDQSTLAAARQAPNQRPGSSAAANLGHVAFGVALTAISTGAARNSRAANGRESHAQYSGCVQASAGLRIGDFASNAGAGVKQSLTVYYDILDQRPIP